MLPLTAAWEGYVSREPSVFMCEGVGRIGWFVHLSDNISAPQEHARRWGQDPEERLRVKYPERQPGSWTQKETLILAVLGGKCSES